MNERETKQFALYDNAMVLLSQHLSFACRAIYRQEPVDIQGIDEAWLEVHKQRQAMMSLAFGGQGYGKQYH